MTEEINLSSSYNFLESGQDTVFYKVNENMYVVSVHLNKKLIENQLRNIYNISSDLIGTDEEKVIVVIGDYNSDPKKYSEIYENYPELKTQLLKPSYPTVYKERYQTCQFDKMLKLANDTIDHCILISHKNNVKLEYGELKTCDENGEITSNHLPSEKYHTDHYMLEVNVNGKILKSSNICGESLGEIALNHYEMIPNQKILLRDEELKNLLLRLKESLEFKDFFEEFETSPHNKTLRKYDLYNIQLPPKKYLTHPFFKLTVDEYEIEYQKFLNDTENNENTRRVGNKMIELFDRLTNDESIENLMDEWTESLIRNERLSYEEVVLRNQPDIVTLQEVNKDLLLKVLNLENYRVYSSMPNKTIELKLDNYEYFLEQRNNPRTFGLILVKIN